MIDKAEIVVLDKKRRWKGPRGLLGLLVPIDSIETHPRNPRRGNLDAIARSLDAFGQTKTIAVQNSTGYVVAGNHTRLAALERLGWTHVAAVRQSFSDAEAIDYLLSDNRSSDLGTYDDDGLLALLDESAQRGTLELTGYVADDLATLAAAANPVPDSDPPAPAPTPGLDRDSDSVTVEELLYTAADRDAFKRFARMLRREGGLDSNAAAVLRAMRESAERL